MSQISRIAFKVIVFAVHFGFAIFLMSWFVNAAKCESGNRANTYLEKRVQYASDQRQRFPVMSEKIDQSYSYNTDYQPMFNHMGLDESCENFNIETKDPFTFWEEWRMIEMSTGCAFQVPTPYSTLVHIFPLIYLVCQSQ